VETSNLRPLRTGEEKRRKKEEAIKTEMLRRNGPVCQTAIKSVGSVLRLEGVYGGKGL